jgi:hypothetical protein
MVCLPISPLPLAWESMVSITNSPAGFGAVRDGSAPLEVFREGRKTVELDEPLRGHRWREIVMFQHPGVGMMHVDGVQSGR